MEQRLANSWNMSLNEKKFIESALPDIRVDGRRSFDYRRIVIKFGRNDGAAEVQVGQTHVMAFVSGELVQPYRDRPNEGTLSIFTEFSPMADPSFESGRPGEAAVELGRVIDRGLRESRAVDMESLCILAGKSVWAIRIDLHILDNGGNIVDAANIAALSALMTFRRPECSLGGEDGQEITVHPPEVKEPVPLTVHHLPIAVTFGIFCDGEHVVIDPMYKEEDVMGGRMTITINSIGDICSIQKAGGSGITRNQIMQCMRIASVKATDITSKIRSAVEEYSIERAKRKIKRHPEMYAKDGFNVNLISHRSVKMDIDAKMEENETGPSLQTGDVHKKKESSSLFTGGPSSWDPYSKGIDSSTYFMPPRVQSAAAAAERSDGIDAMDSRPTEKGEDLKMDDSLTQVQAEACSQEKKKSTLADAVKPKNRRKNIVSKAEG